VRIRIAAKTLKEYQAARCWRVGESSMHEII
jgi:hypothetical protein